jgi:hypothetical protein
MTPDEYRQHSCLRKTPFISRREARQFARLAQGNVGGKINPYHCKFDDHWHIGHSRPKSLRRRTA